MTLHGCGMALTSSSKTLAAGGVLVNYDAIIWTKSFVRGQYDCCDIRYGRIVDVLTASWQRANSQVVFDLSPPQISYRVIFLPVYHVPCLSCIRCQWHRLRSTSSSHSLSNQSCKHISSWRQKHGIAIGFCFSWREPICSAPVVISTTITHITSAVYSEPGHNKEDCGEVFVLPAEEDFLWTPTQRSKPNLQVGTSLASLCHSNSSALCCSQCARRDLCCEYPQPKNLITPQEKSSWTVAPCQPMAVITSPDSSGWAVEISIASYRAW
jgi:hypothetical protein